MAGGWRVGALGHTAAAAAQAPDAERESALRALPLNGPGSGLTVVGPPAGNDDIGHGVAKALDALLKRNILYSKHIVCATPLLHDILVITWMTSPVFWSLIGRIGLAHFAVGSWWRITLNLELVLRCRHHHDPRPATTMVFSSRWGN